MNAIDELVKNIMDEFNNSLDYKVLLIKDHFKFELQRMATTAYNLGETDGIKKEADRCAKPIVREFFDVSGGMKTKQGLHGILYSVEGLIWYSTPETAQAYHDKRKDR